MVPVEFRKSSWPVEIVHLESGGGGLFECQVKRVWVTEHGCQQCILRSMR